MQTLNITLKILLFSFKALGRPDIFLILLWNLSPILFGCWAAL